MLNQGQDLNNFSSSPSTLQTSPLRQEWSLINRFKALEYERIKQRERMLDREKKMNFRKQLDDQMNNKSNADLQERQEDRKYYEGVVAKAEQMRMQEARERQEKALKRKLVEEQNWHKVETVRASRHVPQQSGYNLQIGLKSQQERKERSEIIKKQMMDTLDLQVKEKSEEARRNRQLTLKLEEMANTFGMRQRDPKEGKNFGQSQKIYQYYQQLEQQRKMREKELEGRMVDEARQKKQREQIDRERAEERKKSMDKQMVKETLDFQVRMLNKRRQDENRQNPQEVSYQYIANMFRPKQQMFDRQKYSRDLLQQAEEQRLRKMKENHMSEQEYKFNMNQLSKAVSGSYAQDNYLDRSLGAIGDPKKLGLDDTQDGVKDKDAEIVKKRLENLKNRGTISYTEGRDYNL